MSSTHDHFQEEDRQLAALVRDLENTDGLQPNVVAFLSSKIQNIRNGLQKKNQTLQAIPRVSTSASERKVKPEGLSLAELKRKEYYF